MTTLFFFEDLSFVSLDIHYQHPGKYPWPSKDFGFAVSIMPPKGMTDKQYNAVSNRYRGYDR